MPPTRLSPDAERRITPRKPENFSKYRRIPLAKGSSRHTLGLVQVTRSVSFDRFGSPAEVLSLVETPLPVVGPDEVGLRLLAATINPSDFGIILGKYGRLPELPAVAGREGLAEVVETGIGVSHVQVGDHVVIPSSVGAWQTAMVAPAAGLRVIPRELPIEFGAMATVNPTTAWRILRDAHLEPGTWVVQNAANSSVGLFAIQMAKHLGLKTLNVVRRPELIEPLKAHGGDVVVTEDSGYEKQVAELTNKGNVQLAINSIGGESALRLLNALSHGGTHVTIGAMTFESVRFPTRQLIFENKTVTGFWMDRWLREQSAPRIQVMFDNLFNLVRSGVVTACVAERFPLERFAEALKANNEPKLGKILLMPS
jgi:trans-2-enoyl-CoA reductase